MAADVFCLFVDAAKWLAERGATEQGGKQGRELCLHDKNRHLMLMALLGRLVELLEKQSSPEEESRKLYENSFLRVYTRAICDEFFKRRFVGLSLAKDYPSRCVFERLRQRVWSDVSVTIMIGCKTEGDSQRGIDPFDRDAGQRLLKLSRQLRCPSVDQLFPKRYTRRRAIYEKWVSQEAT